jgi:NAD(P)-dependent dehydrogenase (short-subunit alcohol dehydrogenase family)
VTVVVVTGATAGVGRATAVAFAREGARVGLVARGGDGLEGARQEVEAAGGEALVLPADVSNAEEVETAAGLAERELGPIDIWVNNAMVTVFSFFADLAPEEFRRVTEVTYLGTVHGTMAALRRMRPRDRGTIVQVGSALAYRGIPLQAAYCGAKHAVKGFTESLRTELLHEGSAVRVTMVHLPALNTPQFDRGRTHLPWQPQPVPPIYQPELAAEAVLLSVRTGRRELYVGWPTVATVLGNKLAPGAMDRYLAATGIESQHTDEPADPERPDNLYAPLPGDPGTHGRFDAEAHDGSVELLPSEHRAASSLALLGAVALGASAVRRGRRRARRGPV